jgi:thiol-disulfide isomerase/thioredoxin
VGVGELAAEGAAVRGIVRFALTTLLIVGSIGAGAQTPPTASADALLTRAVARAEAEGKKVFVDFGASWCVPCLRLEAFLQSRDVKPVIDKHFVLVRVTVWETKNKIVLNNPGGEELMDRLRKGTDHSGIPFYAVIDKTRAPIVTGGDYPGRTNEIETFLAMVTKAAPAMTPAERAALLGYLNTNSDPVGSITGQVMSADGKQVANAGVTLMSRAFIEGQWLWVRGRTVKVDEAGRYAMPNVDPGDYQLLAEAPSVTGQYPSSPTPGNRALLTVERNHDFTGGNIVVAPLRPTAVTGTVTRADGTPVGGVTVNAVKIGSAGVSPNATTAADGSFSIANVNQGDYTLWVRVPASTGRAGAPREIGSAAVRVPVSSNVSIRTSPGISLSGPVTIEGAELSEAERSFIRVEAVAVQAPAGAPRDRLQSAIDPQNRIAITGVWGKRVLRAEGLPKGWAIERVTIAGKDVTDTPIDFSTARDIQEVSVTIANRTGTIASVATDADGKPRNGGVVIIFAAEPARWTYPSRFLRFAAVDDKGAYRAEGLLRGEYLVGWLPALDGNWASPESLTKLSASAKTISVR